MIKITSIASIASITSEETTRECSHISCIEEYLKEIGEMFAKELKCRQTNNGYCLRKTCRNFSHPNHDNTKTRKACWPVLARRSQQFCTFKMFDESGGGFSKNMTGREYSPFGCHLFSLFANK